MNIGVVIVSQCLFRTRRKGVGRCNMHGVQLSTHRRCVYKDVQQKYMLKTQGQKAQHVLAKKPFRAPGARQVLYTVHTTYQSKSAPGKEYSIHMLKFAPLLHSKTAVNTSHPLLEHKNKETIIQLMIKAYVATSFAGAFSLPAARALAHFVRFKFNLLPNSL